MIWLMIGLAIDHWPLAIGLMVGRKSNNIYQKKIGSDRMFKKKMTTLVHEEENK